MTAERKLAVNESLSSQEFDIFNSAPHCLFPISPKEIQELDLPKFAEMLLTSGGLKTVDFKVTQLYTLLNIMLNRFKTANRPLLEFEGPFLTVGNLHGRYHTLLMYLNECGPPSKQNYMFLGDYVRRGEHALEAIVLLLVLKLVHPDSVMLIRGNHEMAEVDGRHQLREECLERFGDEDGTRLFDKFAHLFSWMPLAVLVSKKVIFMHGGISKNLNLLDEIRNIQLPVAEIPESVIQGVSLEPH